MLATVTEADKIDFHARHHTYHYQLPDGTLGSSRLDRWYVSASRIAQIVGLSVDPPVSYSDHDAVTLVYTSRPPGSRSGRKRRPRLRYPLPFGCRQAITDLTADAVAAFEMEHLAEDGVLSAKAWDELKSTIRRGCLSSIRVSLRRQKRGIRQRRRRLHSALRASLHAASPRRSAVAATVAGIVERVEELTVDPYAKVVGLRKAIIRLDHRRSRMRRASTFARYSSSSPEAESAFFHRFRTRQGHRAPIVLGDPGAADFVVAERLAADWSSVTQRGATEPAARAAFFEQLPLAPQSPTLADLDHNFTEAEARVTLEAFPRGKEPGPDGLPKDWYRDHGDLLVPVLTGLFDRWHRQRTLPPSFRMATVACNSKTVTPQTGLDFRPIALLDTDYKIYARLLLNRLSPRLPELVAPTQFGFVSGRQVHDALDVFHGLQALVRAGDLPADTLAVLLDFAKAYDTLVRAFLLRALDRLGFPAGFRGAVEQMHLHTTAEYAADDSISTAQLVLNGIRQGCPLAPTLFILAVDTFYELIAADPAVRGIRLPHGPELCATGYADDTTCYLENAASAGPLRAALDRFGAASGLEVNVGKSVAIFLGEDAGSGVRTQSEFPVPAPDVASRLLGGHVATKDVSGSTWATALQQVRARLHWAAVKTTNELQRVKLLRAVLLPKVLFVARHHWPSTAVIEKSQCLVDAYVWGGTLAADGQRKRAWMSSALARTPLTDGGLHIPHLKLELQAMSVATVERWSQPVAGAPAAVCQALLRCRGVEDGLLAPSRLEPPNSHSIQPTLMATGSQLRRALSASPRSDLERALLLQLLPQIGRGTSQDFGWEDGWLTCNYTRVQHLLDPLRRCQAAAFGNLQVHALLQARVVGEDILLTADGRPVLTSDFPGVFRGAARLQDVLTVSWTSSGGIRFRARQHESR